MWIDRESCDVAHGEIGFVVEAVREGVARRALHRAPLRTNLSGVPRLHGWCGETNNVSRHACGLARFMLTNTHGDRVFAAPIVGDEAASFLAANGWPELVEEVVR